jgi:RNA polymerase sigma factor (sigma-70 family)
MTRATLDNILHYARTLAGGVADLPEPCLLDRFLTRSEEAAFAALLERHGPMVLAVCRRVLGNAADAEDAFQATFLVLARKAASLRKRTSVASWLYGVACRVAWRARAAAARRRLHERQAQAIRPVPAPTHVPPDLGDVLGEELARLPESYRLPVVLCYLEGRTHQEAARQLGWPLGSVKGRLARARDLLHGRLTRRGLAPAAALLDAALAGLKAEAVPAALARTTLQVVLAAGAGGAARAAAGPVAALAREALRPARWARPRLALAVVALLAALGGVAALAPGGAAPAPAGQQADPADPDPKPPAAAAKQAGPAADPKPPADPPAAADLFGDLLPPFARARLGTVRFRASTQITHIAYSPDGKLLASVDYQGSVAFWEAATGRRLRGLAGEQGRWAALEYSRDGRFLATSGADGTVKLWDAATGKELRRLPGHRGAAALAFSPSSKLLAVAGWDALTLWEVATGKQLRRQEVTKAAFCCAAFSPDGKSVLAGGNDDSFRVWDVATGRLLRRHASQGSQVIALGFSPGGKILASGTIGGTASLWDAASGKLLHILPAHKGYVRGFAFLGDGDVVAVAHYHSSLLVRAPPAVRFWDVLTGKEVRLLHDCDGSVHGIALSPDGRTLAVADSCSIRRWDLQTGIELPPHGGHHGGVRVLGVSADGRTVFTGGEEGDVRRWDTATGKVARSHEGHLASIYSGGLSADGKVLCSGASDRAVLVWDPKQTRPRLQLPAARTRNLRALALTADGRTLATSADQQGLSLWDAATGTELRCLAPEEMFHCLAFAPDGKTLASAGSDRRGHHLKFWDVATGMELADITGVESIQALAFSPDGRRLAACEYVYGDNPGRVRLFDRRGIEVRRLRGHRGSASGVAFDPRGWMLASAGQDGTVRLWELATGQERRVLRGHHGGVSTVAFAADGRTLVSSALDTTVLVWDAAGLPGKAAPTEARLRQCWEALASPDATRAYDAICRLATSPKQAIPLLRADMLGPRETPEQVRRWIRELDDKRFAVRERATAGLKKLGREVEADLRRALAKGPTEEARRRLGRLLADLPARTAPLSARDLLQRLRTLEVLDRAGTPEARRLVEALAAGPADSPLARQAQAVLRRLGKLPKS